MRWGILSDIHGNLEALEAALVALHNENIDKYLCLGDIVGYGANPSECITKTKNLNPVTIAGNHDWASCGLFDVTYFNPLAKTAVLWTAEQLSEQDRHFLRDLKLIYRQDDFSLVHGSLNGPERFEYIFSISDAAKTFGLMQSRVCFVGHSHAPVNFIKKGENYTFNFQQEVLLEDGANYIINAGSIGQPRDGNPQAAYVIYDTDKKLVQIKRMAYDIQAAQDKIIKAGLPQMLAQRLALGK